MLWKEIAGVSVTAVIIGLVELAKQAGLNPRYSGHLSWLLGLAIAISYGIVAETGHNMVELFLIGSALGLSAAGFYSVGKVHYRNFQKRIKKLRDKEGKLAKKG